MKGGTRVFINFVAIVRKCNILYMCTITHALVTISDIFDTLEITVLANSLEHIVLVAPGTIRMFIPPRNSLNRFFLVSYG